MAVLGQGDDGLEVGLDHGEADGGCIEPLLRVGHLSADALLLGAQEVDRDGVGVVRLEELEAFGVEPLEARCLLSLLDLAVHLPVAEEVLDGLYDLVDTRGGQDEAAIVLGYEVLDDVDGHGSLGAGGALLVAAEADEVLVGGAVPVLVQADDEAATAVAAEDRALQVMVMNAFLFASRVLGIEDILNLLPDLGCHERLVLTGVTDAAVDDDALVVRVAE